MQGALHRAVIRSCESGLIRFDALSIHIFVPEVKAALGRVVYLILCTLENGEHWFNSRPCRITWSVAKAVSLGHDSTMSLTRCLHPFRVIEQQNDGIGIGF